MLKGIFADASPLTKLFIIAFALVVSFFIINLIGILLLGLLLKMHFADIMSLFQNIDYSNHHDVNILKYLQIIQTVSLFAVPPLIIGYLFSDNTFTFLNMNRTSGFLSIIIAMLIMYSCMPLIEWMIDINSQLRLPRQLHAFELWMKESESNAETLTKAFLEVSTYKGLLLNIIMIAVIPAIGEEFLFRGVLVRFFREWTRNVHAAVIISAVIFSLIHFQFYGFLPRMMLGILLGYLFVWSGSIWIPVLVHFTNNGTAVAASYLESKGMIHNAEKVFSFGNEYLFIILSAVATAAFILLFFFYTKSSNRYKLQMTDD